MRPSGLGVKGIEYIVFGVKSFFLVFTLY